MHDTLNNNPLVSVAVITYNSSKTVIETLESIQAQTYQNIELIISDDYSKDDTVKICKEWVEENLNRFVRVEIVESPVNTGVSANGNRAEDACRGDWVKPIAGDDVLLPWCIEVYMGYIEEHPEAKVLFGRVKAFGASDDINERFNTSVFDYAFLKKGPTEQLSRLLCSNNYIPAAAFFYNRVYVRSTGIRNDERIPLLEDWPKWINMLRKGIVFDVIDSDVVRYRISESSLSTTSTLSLVFRKSNALFFKYYQFWPQLKGGHVSHVILKRLDAEKIIGGNNLFWRCLNRMYSLYRRLKRVGEPIPEFF